MDTQLAQNALSPNWRLVCGILIVAAAVKEGVARIAQSPIAFAAAR
jgi:hypothetical protein